MRYWPQIARALWYTSMLLQALLLFFIYAKKVFRWSPAFAAYVTGLVTISCARLWLQVRLHFGSIGGFSSWAPTMTPMTLEVVASLIGVFATTEVCSRIFDGYPKARLAWRIWKRRLLGALAAWIAIVLVMALLNLRTGIPVGLSHRVLMILDYANNGIAPTALAAISASLAICRRYRTLLPVPEGMLLLGLGLNFGLNSLAAVSWLAGARWETLYWWQFQGLYYFAALLIWHFAIFSDRRIREES
jgi:hypothetical protein